MFRCVYKRFLISSFTLMILASCSSGQDILVASDTGESVVRGNCEPGGCEKYSGFLLDRDRYSRGGETLHEKFRWELLCLSAGLVERQDMTLLKGSMGFYHDKRAGSRSPFYVGFDILTEYDGSLDYGRFCTGIIRENVDGIAEEVRQVDRIFEEKDVAGVAVTFLWTWNNTDGRVTIWLGKNDIRAFNEGKITASELYQRSTITNTSGNVILLPI